MEKIMWRVVSETLQNVTFATAAPQQAVEHIQATADVSDLLDVLLSSMEEI